jgi:predicted cupin superfamily sugar epimerase
MGTTVAPGFDFADYERGSRAELLAKYSKTAAIPDITGMITALTRG